MNSTTNSSTKQTLINKYCKSPNNNNKSLEKTNKRFLTPSQKKQRVYLEETNSSRKKSPIHKFTLENTDERTSYQADESLKNNDFLNNSKLSSKKMSLIEGIIPNQSSWRGKKLSMHEMNSILNSEELLKLKFKENLKSVWKISNESTNDENLSQMKKTSDFSLNMTKNLKSDNLSTLNNIKIGDNSTMSNFENMENFNNNNNPKNNNNANINNMNITGEILINNSHKDSIPNILDEADEEYDVKVEHHEYAAVEELIDKIGFNKNRDEKTKSEMEIISKITFLFTYLIYHIL